MYLPFCIRCCVGVAAAILPEHQYAAGLLPVFCNSVHLILQSCTSALQSLCPLFAGKSSDFFSYLLFQPLLNPSFISGQYSTPI